MATLSATLLRELDADDLTMALVGGDKAVALVAALGRAEDYLREAALQQNRMKRLRGDLRRFHKAIREAAESRGEKPFPRNADHGRMLRRLFCAAHWYVNSWNIVGLHLSLLSNLCRWPLVGRAMRPYRKAFDAYRDARDHLEHFDERLPGQKSEHRMLDKRELVVMHNDDLRFGGRKVHIGPKSLTSLRNAVTETTEAFKREAADRLAAAHPRQFERLLWEAQGSIASRRIMRRQGRLSTDDSGRGGTADRRLHL